MTSVAVDHQLEAQVRAHVYVALSSLIPYPNLRPDLGILEHIEFEDRMLEAARAALVSADTGLGSMQAQHRILFSAVESQDAPSYETAYSKHDVFRQAQVMADVAGFYLAHGLKPGGKRRDRPDGVGSQLEFLGVVAAQLSRALAEGDDDAVDLCRETRRTFLADHVGRWIPDYGRRVAAVSHDPFYVAFGEFIARWVELDMEELGVDPSGPELRPEEGRIEVTTAVADPRIRWDDDGFSCEALV
ncbi:MAG: molecular chaperone TorD family protein [Acidimicrobiia bacterium]|nr:molecular chaperone TorD family protein [Acidimicrobiia bacterium]